MDSSVFWNISNARLIIVVLISDETDPYNYVDRHLGYCNRQWGSMEETEATTVYRELVNENPSESRLILQKVQVWDLFPKFSP